MEMEKAYEPSKYESNIYKHWEQSGAFKPSDAATGEPFSIIMPPPNANGDLHLGHAMYTVEDIMVRYARMSGRPTLWLPGADHAGIETQVVYERELAKEGKSRLDLGRDQFYKQALAFTKKNMVTMQDQIRKLGFSVDWSRFKFTLEDDILDTVYATFKQLHEDGLLYRGNRIVNWCPHCRSGFADIEIKHREQIDPLYYVKYGPFVIATVRPEPMFADTAIAVHPDDERYQKWIGKEVEVELLWGKRTLKVIADRHVDPDFGSGVIKLTPAHDPNDWDMAQEHDLEVIPGIGTDGLMTEAAGKYAGMPVLEAREQIAQALDKTGLIDHVEMDYKHNVAYHDRCGTLIEPLVTEQWWLKVEPLVKPAIEAVETGKIKIVPSRFKKPYTDWLANLRDWNISRQNWFGIRIPVYYNASGDSSKQPYVITTDESEAEAYYGKGGYETETDTFDTWFSSSQWPFATLMATGDYDRFYPTSVMETGRDILFQWVTRMVMLGLYRTGKVPFQTVYLHGLIQDEQGKKMSKSKGNVINPLEMTDKYGTDAVRLALTIGITPGNDGALSENKIEGYRNFANKLWNVTRFILTQLPADYSPSKPEAKTMIDEWILSRLAQEITIVTRSLDSYSFSEAGQAVYGLLWNDFADWYIEASKLSPNLDILVFGLETILKLTHPIAPFVTEAIWQKMAWQKQDLISTPWPTGDANTYSSALVRFESVKQAIEQIRSAATDLNLSKPAITTKSDVILENAELIKRLARVSAVTKTEQGSGLALTVPGHDIWLEADTAALAQYSDTLEGQREEQRAYMAKLQAQLENKAYLSSAPAKVVQDTRDRLEQAQVVLSKLNEQLKRLEN